MAKIVLNIKKVLVQKKKRSVISWHALLRFSLCKCFPNLYHKHVVFSFSGDRGVLWKVHRSSESKYESELFYMHIISIVAVWRCSTLWLEKNKLFNTANTKYQTRTLFTCSNSTLTCSLNSCSFSFESLTSVVFCASCAWKNTHIWKSSRNCWT